MPKRNTPVNAHTPIDRMLATPVEADQVRMLLAEMEDPLDRARVLAQAVEAIANAQHLCVPKELASMITVLAHGIEESVTEAIDLQGRAWAASAK